ncbi:MAG: hypothetical protein ABF915_01210, partial [Schleiferilactobacillus harbinensis]
MNTYQYHSPISLIVFHSVSHIQQQCFPYERADVAIPKTGSGDQKLGDKDGKAQTPVLGFCLAVL